jgi:GT2 family glycosyltransferase
MSNPPKIHIITIAYGLADDLYRLVDCADGAGITWHIFLHSQFPDVVAMCDELDEMKNTHIYSYGNNRGVARSWNEGLYLAYTKYGADVAFIANDDAVCSHDDLMKLTTVALNSPNAFMVSGHGHDVRGEWDGDMSFSMGAVTRKAIETIGYFDQNFFPMYFEDTDWYRRAYLATGGMDWKVVVPDTHIIHQGSKSIHTVPGLMEQHHQTFVANHDYYTRKWGGEPKSERFYLPFDESRFGLCVPYECVDNPYGEYDRIDHDIVRM